MITLLTTFNFWIKSEKTIKFEEWEVFSMQSFFKMHFKPVYLELGIGED
jgi:hypothetical protein